MDKGICILCEEYSVDTECENQDTCKINKVIKENEALKNENKKLQKEISDLKHRMSYMPNPFAIGDRHEMGG